MLKTVNRRWKWHQFDNIVGYASKKMEGFILQKNNKFKSIQIFVWMLILILSTATTIAAENILIFAKDTEAEGFDPHMVPASSSIQIYNRIYEALVGFSPGGDIVPELAESWEILDDQTYKFNLRQGVRFHDGSEMTSQDVKFSYLRMIDPEGGSLARSYFDMVEKIETPDDYTVIFYLDTPFADFLINVGHTYAKIVPQAVVEEHGDLMNVAVGTGPFMLEEWVPDNYTFLKAFPDYYEEGIPRLDGVRFVIMEDESAQMAAIRTGQAHMTDISPEGARIMEGRRGVRVVEYPSFNYTYWAFNVTEAPFDDPKVRLAMSYAIDRELLAAVVYDGFADVTGPVPPSQEVWAVDISEYPSYQYNPEKALELLKEAGYDGDLSFEITASSAYPWLVDTAVMIQEQLAQIGVQADIKMVDWGTYIQTWIHRDHQSMVGRNGAGSTPERALYFFFHTNGGANVWGFSNEEYDELVERARVIVDQEERAAVYAQAQRLLVNELAPNLFINSPSQFYIVREEVQGFNPTPYMSEGLLPYLSLGD